MPVLDSYSTDREIVVKTHTPAGATGGDLDGRLFLAFDAYEVVWAGVHYQTAGSSTTVSIDVLKVLAAQARASGVSVLSAVVDCSGASNAIKVPALTATVANRRLAVGDTLDATTAGTLTALDGVTVQAVLRKI